MTNVIKNSGFVHRNTDTVMRFKILNYLVDYLNITDEIMELDRF